MVFGQVIIGPAGSGKTTYCHENEKHCILCFEGRKAVIVNLDPANDVLPFAPAIDVSDLVSLERVQEEQKLGPNGGTPPPIGENFSRNVEGLVYCMDVLYKNIDWLEEKLKPLAKGEVLSGDDVSGKGVCVIEGYYFLFDCPGQVELFTLHESVKQMVHHLYKNLSYRLTAVHLVDAQLCSDPHKYISALVLSLSTMLHLELPHINVLSKMDLIQQYGDLDFRLDFYTEVQDLSVLLDTMTDEKAFSNKFRSLSSAICEVVEDFSLVGFTPLSIQDRESVSHLVKLIDKSNGFVYTSNLDPSQFLTITKPEEK